MLTDPSLEPSQQDEANEGHSKKKEGIPKLSMIPFLILGTVIGQGFNAIPNHHSHLTSGLFHSSNHFIQSLISSILLKLL